LGTDPRASFVYVFSFDNEGGEVNVVTLIGNLASDVDLRELGDDRRVASFLLAVDRQSSAGGADFIQVSVWNKQAEACSRCLSKGKQVALDGRLRSRAWEDADGNRRRAVEVVANRVQFLSPPESSAGVEAPFEEGRLPERTAA
jgi:single-strand DNA-binding protein